MAFDEVTWTEGHKFVRADLVHEDWLSFGEQYDGQLSALPWTTL